MNIKKLETWYTIGMFGWLRQQVHAVFLIVGLAVGILAGCLLVYIMPSTWFTAWSWWIVWMGIVGAAFYKSQRVGVGVVLLVGVMMGYGRGAQELASWVDVSQMPDQTVVLRGVVQEDPGQGSGSDRQLRLRDVQVDGRSYGGTYWVVVSGRGVDMIQRSDAVTVQGTLQAGFGTFAGSMYRATIKTLESGVRFDPMLSVRNTFANTIRGIIPDPEAALGIGYILGQKRALPPDFEDALLTVGLTHVVVASGYNLTILVRLCRRLFIRVSRYTALIASSGLVLAFIGVTGMSPSMSRAGLVAGLSLLAWYYGRTIHPGVLLVVAAAATVVIRPSYAWGDVGWMLSFASFAGVMFLAPLLQAYFYGEKKPGILRQILGETFSAQLVTLPIILVTFGVMSNVALLANVLVLPLVPLAMLLTFAAGVTGCMAPGLSWLVATPAYWLLGYMTWIIVTLAELEWASVKIEVSIWLGLAMMLGILLLMVVLWRRTRLSFREVNLVE